MGFSKVQIFNIALNILGISAPVENTKSQDSRIILLNNYYELARDFVLKDFDWNFASSLKELSLVSKNTGKFKYSFEYPNNCISAREVFEKDNHTAQKFMIACDENSSKIILTNIKQPVLRYTKRIEKETFFTSEFSIALAHYLASLTSNVLTGNMQKGEIAYQKYITLLKHAKVLNATEGTDITYEQETYLDSRG